MSSRPPFIALAGNPNSGKSTAFNKYTGARQHVSNYPGITVEKKEGTTQLDGRKIVLVDLPGTYSLTAYSQEEVVARRVLVEERPGAVINVVNAGVLERNLYLSVQLLEMGVPVVLALNMMDEARAKGLVIDVEKLEEITGIKAVLTVAKTGEGLGTALKEAMALAESQEGQVWRPLNISYGSDIDASLAEMIPLIEDGEFLTNRYPSRWVALKYLEKDEDILQQGKVFSAEISDHLQQVVDRTTKHLEATLRTYPEAIIADYRYGYITSVLRQGVLKGADELKNRIAYSDMIDTVLTSRLLGPLILFGVLYLMYWLTFRVGQYPADWLESAFGWLRAIISEHMADGFLKSMITAGIIDGVGGVMSFVPLIAIMFLLISFLEDSGYMARVAYMMDRIFRMFGLHGASVMPFIVSGGIAGGCAIPGVLATRTLRSPKERLATMLTAPFMACGAKLPVFLLIVGVFFSEHQALVMFMLTLTGWVAALLVALLLRSTVIRGEATPFVMELPPYRMPTMAGILIHSWERIWQYFKKAGTIILAISILLWAAMTFPGLSEERENWHEEKITAINAEIMDKKAEGGDIQPLLDALTKQANLQSTETLRASLAGRVGTALEIISSPAGFDWRTNIALLGGVAAKEVVVSTLGTAYSLGEIDPGDTSSLADRIRADTAQWNMASGVSLLLFTLLYSPCFVTLAAIKSESGQWKWVWFSLFFNLFLAYLVAVAAFQGIGAFL